MNAPHQGEAGVLVDHVSAFELFRAFLWIGARSWGGGPSTIFIMNQDLVRRGWITTEQFTLDFGLSRLVPGINLLAVSIMLGFRLGGVPGSIGALLGLLLPATIITFLLTLGFVTLTENPIGAAVIKGVVPVTAALTFALAYEQGREVIPFDELRTCLLMIAYSIAAFFLVVLFQASVALVIGVGIAIGALLFGPPRGRL